MIPFRLFYATISTPNRDRLSAWYQEKLGFELFINKDFPEFGTRIAVLTLYDFRLEILEQANAVPMPLPQHDPPDHTNVHCFSQIALLVEDLDEAISALESKGVEKVWVLRDDPTLKLKFQFFKDCDGRLLQFVELYPEAKSHMTDLIRAYPHKFSYLPE
jgi:hypothetical protein